MLMRNITLRQLRAFLAVARARSFTRAASELNLTQSALTMAIRGLEAEVGLRLLDRSTRAVFPTAHGERFFTTAERLLEEMERAIDDLRAIADRQSGLVVMAATASFIGPVVAPALRAVAGRFPGIAVRLIEEHTDGAARRLLAGELDFAITTLPKPEPGIEAIPLMRDRFGLLCQRGHPLARAGKSLGWGVLDDFPLVGMSQLNGMRRMLDQDPHGVHAVRNLRYEVSSMTTLCSLVESGVGVGAVPALAARPLSGSGLAWRALVPAVHRTASLARRAGRSLTPAAAEVVTEALEQLRQLRDPGIEVLTDQVSLLRQGWILRPG
jgi:LysR family carnitine catabolism transcriptional activator